MRIITHNVYWFQGYPSRWGTERVAEAPAVLEALTGLYAAAQVDVLCLQEVQRGDLAGSIAKELLMEAWFHVLGGERTDYGSAIMCRQLARFGDHTRVGGHALHERVHLRACLRLGNDRLELALTHLPSNRFAGSPDAGNTARIAELRRVLDKPPRPDLVLGDMNCRAGSQPYGIMLESGYIDASAAATGAAMHQGPDFIWLEERRAGRLRDFKVLNDGAFCPVTPDGKTWQLSDHPPLLVELQ